MSSMCTPMSIIVPPPARVDRVNQLPRLGIPCRRSQPALA